MTVKSKIKSRNERDCLSETELNGVAAGESVQDYARMTQMLSNILRTMADTQKAIIANVR